MGMADFRLSRRGASRPSPLKGRLSPEYRSRPSPGILLLLGVVTSWAGHLDVSHLFEAARVHAAGLGALTTVGVAQLARTVAGRPAALLSGAFYATHFQAAQVERGPFLEPTQPPRCGSLSRSGDGNGRPECSWGWGSQRRSSDRRAVACGRRLEPSPGAEALGRGS